MKTMTEPIYDVDYFIQKFTAIPEDRWCEDFLFNAKGQRCVLGHCGVEHRFVETLPAEASALIDLLPHDPAAINNNRIENLRLQQPTPKARILAALQAVKEGRSLCPS